MRKSELQEGSLHNNLKVEIKNAHEIYLERQRMLGENQGVPDISLSQTDLDGRIFERECTGLGIVTQNPGESFYSIQSQIFLTNEEQGQEPFGFYSLERVAKIQDELQKLGVISHLIDEQDSSWLELMLDARDTVAVRASFGLRSRQDYGHSLRELITHASPTPRKLLIRHAVRVAQNQPTNSEITVELINREQPRMYPWSYQLDDEQQFISHLNAYSYLYEKLLTALYREKGREPPSVSIVFEFTGAVLL